MVWPQSWSFESLLALWLRLFRPGTLAVLASGLWLGQIAEAFGGDEAASGQRLNPELTDADYTNPTNGLGCWIWAAKTFDRQECQLWKSFEIPVTSKVKKARLRMTADNEYIFLLDGRELGRGAEWRHLYEYNLSYLLSPGKHVLAVKAFNSDAAAGVLFGLRVELAEGGVVEVKSDTSWRIVPNGSRGWEERTQAPNTWPAATAVAALGELPWWKTPEAIEILPTMRPVKLYFWQTGWFQVSLLSLSGLVILISLRLVAQLALHRKEQWLLQQERARIARDIHDDLGSRMTQLVLHGEVAQSELPPESETRLQIDRICEDARGILSTMDEILWAVNPKRDAFRDFTSFICGHVEEFFKSSRIQCLFDVDQAVSPVALSLPLKRTLLMVVKETLNNTVKHSEATEVVLQIKWQAQRLIVAISDNGKGFDQATLKPGRNGLVNMSQRMTEVGGTCVITSQPGKGCRTEFSIPLRQARPAWNRLWRLDRSSEPRNAKARTPANQILQIHDPTNY